MLMGNLLQFIVNNGVIVPPKIVSAQNMFKCPRLIQRTAAACMLCPHVSRSLWAELMQMWVAGGDKRQCIAVFGEGVQFPIYIGREATVGRLKANQPTSYI
jgi:hypothetical protein